MTSARHAEATSPLAYDGRVSVAEIVFAASFLEARCARNRMRRNARMRCARGKSKWCSMGPASLADLVRLHHRGGRSVKSRRSSSTGWTFFSRCKYACLPVLRLQTPCSLLLSVKSRRQRLIEADMQDLRCHGYKPLFKDGGVVPSSASSISTADAADLP